MQAIAVRWNRSFVRVAADNDFDRCFIEGSIGVFRAIKKRNNDKYF
jgi:hypothetical protein